MIFQQCCHFLLHFSFESVMCCFIMLCYICTYVSIHMFYFLMISYCIPQSVLVFTAAHNLFPLGNLINVLFISPSQVTNECIYKSLDLTGSVAVIQVLVQACVCVYMYTCVKCHIFGHFPKKQNGKICTFK